jgi:glucosamine-6-phosphate deaminase
MTARQDFRQIERIPCLILANSREASRQVAAEIAGLIRIRQAEGRSCVLGLATGSTPTGIYAELVRLHREEGLSFRNVITFNLDEYYPMQPEDVQSYVRFMREHLFDHISTYRRAAGMCLTAAVSLERVNDYCRDYEARIAAAGGIDIQILGIGRTGHIGFNEPGSAT